MSIYNRRLESFLDQGMKSEYYPELLAEVKLVCQNLGFRDQDVIVSTLENLWLPVALDLASNRQNLNRTWIQGILGGQGTGKSTLCKILQLILSYFGFSAAALSLDDLYLTFAERKVLREREDSPLIYRGPPGTHDLDLGLRVLEQCLDGNNQDQIELPRFDKSAHDGQGDRTTPEVIDKPDILLFEGWFVGAQPIAQESFDNSPPPIVTPEDQQLALDSNQRLQDYLPLWSKLDSLIVLYPRDYRYSMQWRMDAEHQMDGGGMTDDQIEKFVEYFWKTLHPELFIHPLTLTANLVVELESDHSVGRIY